MKRRVGNDACVEVDTNHYSVPWRLIRCDVTVLVEACPELVEGNLREALAFLCEAEVAHKD